MSDLKRKTIAAQVIRLARENARMRVALIEIEYRSQLALNSRELDGCRIETTMTDIRNTAQKALKPPDGMLTIKKGLQ